MVVNNKKGNCGRKEMVVNNKKGNCGRKRKDYSAELAALALIPKEERNTYRKAAAAANIPESTLRAIVKRTGPENSISEALAVYIQKQQHQQHATAMAGATTSAAASMAASYFSPQQAQVLQNRHYYPNQPYLHTPNLLSLHPNFLLLPSVYALQQQNYALQLQQQQLQQQVHQLQKKVKTLEQKDNQQEQEAAVGIVRLVGTSPESSSTSSTDPSLTDPSATATDPSATATDNATDNAVADEYISSKTIVDL